ncbi:alpha/beta fold hydrolase [Bradyrhizobium japonicum]|uniref:alpha/beta fold hydrolase n=1 Tax=Bradyrhizobium japonicum TaxID=375 RepID=UPI00271467EE|nr:alpha/beta hydrolase [Bradyrhizobium japonicum]WLB58014.1 alpha/beta hydrolase [Bradyrhizobium japonicum]WLB60119.1 alpha/beta hydrolase [Bradyrhizobium japonicum]
MVRMSVIASVLLCLALPSNATSAPLVKEVDVNGVRLSYVDQGSGEPVVFVHGAVSDLRTWDMIRDGIASKYRFIAYTQRYCETRPWNDDGKLFSTATHANDLAKFIESLNAGPVDVVGWSYGGAVAATAPVQNPSLFRSVILWASLLTVLPADSPDGKAAREDRSRMYAPAAAAAKAGEPVKATRLLLEAVFQLPPGRSDREPQALQTMWDQNARTTPLFFTAPPPPVVTCDMLRTFAQPTLILEGEKTAAQFRLINDAITSCVPKAQRVVLKSVTHDAPVHDPASFSSAILDFLAKRPGL